MKIALYLNDSPDPLLVTDVAPLRSAGSLPRSIHYGGRLFRLSDKHPAVIADVAASFVEEDVMRIEGGAQWGHAIDPMMTTLSRTVLSLLPPAEATNVESDDVMDGPMADRVPSIWVHLLLIHIRRLEAEIEQARLHRSMPVQPPVLRADEWPVDSIRVTILAIEAAAEGQTHLALPVVSARQLLDYCVLLEREVAKVPTAICEFEAAAIIRGAAEGIVNNVDGYSGELEAAGVKTGYVRQAIREINTVVRRVGGGGMLQ